MNDKEKNMNADQEMRLHVLSVVEANESTPTLERLEDVYQWVRGGYLKEDEEDEEPAKKIRAGDFVVRSKGACATGIVRRVLDSGTLVVDWKYWRYQRVERSYLAAKDLELASDEQRLMWAE